MVKPCFFVVGLALVACMALRAEAQPGVPYSLSEQEISLVQRDVTRSMKDPDSARFGNIAAAKSGQGAVIVCGFVNGKNSFGGYTGEVPFMGILKSSGYLVLDIASTENEYRAMIKTCRKEGVAI